MKRNNVSLGTIVGGMSRLQLHDQTFVLDRTKQIFKSKVFALEYTLKQNYALYLNGEVIDIDPKETWEKVEKAKPGNYDKVLEALKKEARNIKRSMKLQVNESYLEALEDGADIPTNDYLKWLEETIIAMSTFEKEDGIEEAEILGEKTNAEIEEEEKKAEEKAIKEEYKKIFGKSPGRKSIETIKSDISEANKED